MRKIGGYEIINAKEIAAGEIAIHFFITAAFALSYDSPFGLINMFIK